MRISDWSSDVCSSDLPGNPLRTTSIASDILLESDQRLELLIFTESVDIQFPAQPRIRADPIGNRAARRQAEAGLADAVIAGTHVAVLALEDIQHALRARLRRIDRLALLILERTSKRLNSSHESTSRLQSCACHKKKHHQ